MNKTANPLTDLINNNISPTSQTLLKGMGSWGALGAGAGALGMGAAHMMAPQDPNDPEAKRRGLLKSMLLGGALGGTFGAGGRAITDVLSPAMAREPGTAFNTLFSPTPEGQKPGFLDMMRGSAWHPFGTGGGVGLASYSAQKIMQHSHVPIEDKDLTKLRADQAVAANQTQINSATDKVKARQLVIDNASKVYQKNKTTGITETTNEDPKNWVGRTNLKLKNAPPSVGRFIGRTAMHPVTHGVAAGVFSQWLQNHLINKMRYDNANSSPEMLQQTLQDAPRQ